MTSKELLGIVVVFGLVGCSSAPSTSSPDEEIISKETRQDIATCSAGIEMSKGLKASISGGLEKEKKVFNGALSADYKEAVRNTILGDTTLSEALKSKFLDLYFPCIEKRLQARAAK